MIIAVQLGALAACVVVLVPMALAGWHLSRNKMLFFSGALFISLAVAVHLSPYFPSLSDFFPSISVDQSSLEIINSRQSCFSQLARVNFTSNSWNWVQSDGNVVACDFQKVGRVDAGDLLNGSWVMIVGDSQARLLVVSLLSLILVEDEIDPIQPDLFKRHSDYHLVVGRLGLKLDFIWAPFVNNLTDLVNELSRNQTCPDVLVMGSGLWHMLHVTNSIDYRDSLVDLGGSVMSLLVPRRDLSSVSSKPVPHLFWLGMPTLVNSMLNTEEKREKLTNETQVAYFRGIQSSNLLNPNGPFMLLDIQSLSENCGVRCTEDGMHYNAVVYKAVVDIMLNALLIQSHQKL